MIVMYIMHSAPGAETVIDGRSYLYFIGTGYLGLQGHRAVIRAACAALEKYGVHSATTRRAFGNQQIVLDVERQAAEYFGAEDGFYYISGYQGNSTLLGALQANFDRVLVDEQAHYSVTAAIQLAGLKSTPFRHCDVADLTEQLRTHLAAGEKPIVMTDGVFPVSGDIAPLAKYVEVLAAYDGAAISVDDAHGVGVLGERGRGCWEYAGLDGPWVNALPNAELPAAAPGVRLYTCGTLSKAFGGSGGIICGSRDFVAALKAGSRYYDAASAPAAPVAGASLAGLQLAGQGELRASLARNVVRFKTGLRRLGFDVADTPVPYVGLVAGDAANMQRIQHALMDHGIAVAYLATYSSVGPQGALRIAVFATHTEAMIDRLLENLAAVL